MTKIESSNTRNPAALRVSGPALHRSGAVAQMLGMPVATLRVWERRYSLTRRELASRTQRLYSDEDVQRLALIKQLTDLGHAIGSVAQLDMQQLRQVSTTRAHAAVTARSGTRPSDEIAATSQAWHLAVIGSALGARLQRPALLRRLGRQLVLLGPFSDLAQAARVLKGAHVDALLVHEPQLHVGWLVEVNATAPNFSHLPRAVLYTFASDAACEALAEDGTALLREPQPDAVVAQWLVSLSARRDEATQLTNVRQPLGVVPVPPRRWDTAALSDFASMSPTIACECPRHLAELLIQLSHFEVYSAECEHRNNADAEIHVHLKAVAADARVRFEAALEYVALHEGLLLPRSSLANSAAVSVISRQPGAEGRMRSNQPTHANTTAPDAGAQAVGEAPN